MTNNLTSLRALAWKAYTSLRGTVFFELFRLPLLRRVSRAAYDRAFLSGVLIDIDGRKMWVRPKQSASDSRVEVPLLERGVYERTETKLFESIARPGMPVIDVGAHIGYYTTLAARIVGPQGRVIAFEPDAENYSVLIRNIDVNGYDNVTLVQRALGETTGQAEPFLADAHASGRHSLVRRLSDDLRELPEPQTSVLIEITTLDEFLGNDLRADVIKMDVEGAELAVIAGMRRTIESNRDIRLIMEWSPWLYRAHGPDPEKSVRWLFDRGFNVSEIDERTRSLLSISLSRALEMCSENRQTNLFLSRSDEGGTI